MVEVEDGRGTARIVVVNEVKEIAVGVIKETEIGLVTQKQKQVNLRVRPETQLPSLNIPIFRSFSTASKKGTTTTLFYRTRKTLTVVI